ARRRLVIDRQGEVPRIAGQHDAVVAPRAVHRDVLVEHVVEHALRETVERIAPATPSAVVVLVALAGLVLDVPPLLAYLVARRAARTHHQPIRGAGTSASDTGHRIPLAHDVGVDRRRHQHLLAVEAAAVAAVLARTSAVGLIVAPEVPHGEDGLVDLAGGA